MCLKHFTPVCPKLQISNSLRAGGWRSHHRSHYSACSSLQLHSCPHPHHRGDVGSGDSQRYSQRVSQITVLASPLPQAPKACSLHGSSPLAEAGVRGSCLTGPRCPVVNLLGLLWVQRQQQQFYKEINSFHCKTDILLYTRECEWLAVLRLDQKCPLSRHL